MNNLISRQAAIIQLSHNKKLGDDEWELAVTKDIQTIRQLPSVQPKSKTEKALRLLVEWAVECDFGYDNIPEEYEKYKDEIQGMGYTEGLIYIAEREVEHEQVSD